ALTRCYCFEGSPGLAASTSGPNTPAMRVPNVWPFATTPCMTRPIGRAHCVALRKHCLHTTPDRLAILDGLQSNRNAISGLEDLLGPTSEVGHVRGIAWFCNPMDHVPFFVGCVEFQPAMRIGPDPFRDGCFQGELLVGIEIGIAMMCE